MKLPKYNLDYNTRDLMNTLAKIASDRKHNIEYLIGQTKAVEEIKCIHLMFTTKNSFLE